MKRKKQRYLQQESSQQMNDERQNGKRWLHSTPINFNTSVIQVAAQLSQRDRDAGCLVLAKSGRLEVGTGRQYFTDIIGLISITVT